jgi:hypothetical protein
VKLRFWYKVFGATEDGPSPSAMLNSLRPRVDGLAHEFVPDNELWRSGRFRLSSSVAPAILVRRTRCGDDGFLEELENMEHLLSAVLDEPHRDLIVSHIHRTQQVINLVPLAVIELGPSKKARICEQLCGFLARTTEGLIQVYQEGFFGSDGESLLPYCPRHKLKTM